MKPANIAIPANERWLHEPETMASLNKALAWALSHPTDDSTTEALLKEWEDGLNLEG